MDAHAVCSQPGSDGANHLLMDPLRDNVSEHLPVAEFGVVEGELDRDSLLSSFHRP